MPNQLDTAQVGQNITLLKHGQEYAAKVTSVNEDGSLEVMAISKFNSDFAQSRVNRAAVVPVPEFDANTPYWTDAV